MVELKFFSKSPIKDRTSVICMIAFSILIFLSALTLMKIQLSGFEVPLKLIGVILLFAVLINILEIGLKRLTNISTLKRLEPQQVVSLIIASFVLISALFFLFGKVPVFISNFASGLLFLEGGVVLLEVFY